MKVTKSMMERAENAHLRKEDYRSLIKSHALKSLYYKQKGKTKVAKYYLTGAEVRRMVAKLEGKGLSKKKR